MSEFRFSAQRVLLTYPQSETLTREAVYFTLDERYPIKLYTIGMERHQDGGFHIHATIEFQHKVDSRDCTCFDVTAYNEEGELVTYHPNIAAIKRGKAHWERAEEYARKEDPTPLTNIEPKLTWGEIAENSSTPDEYLDLIKKHYPRDHALNYDRLLSYARNMYGQTVNTLPNGFEITYEYDEPVELTNYTDFTKSVVVTGPAGCGKTTWAKKYAPKPALFVRHLDSLSLYNGHKSIIFDDLDFKHMPPSGQKFLVDMENLAEIHVRYRVARIPAGVSRIFTANEYPFTEDPIHGPAIDRRVNKIFI